MKIALYNSHGRVLEPFKPLTDKEVKLYACGPTVYNYAHLGNLRTYIFEDLLVRTLTYAGYKVRHVMNITDVGHLTGDGDEGEDKMLKSAQEKGMTPWDIAKFYADAFFADTARLNIQTPTVICKATEHIQDMIDLIKILEEKGFTYQAEGNVYFDVSKFPKYGEMALLDRTELKAGARIEVDTAKRNPQDFVLWFTNSKFGRQAMVWESPWGVGYPGWHVECSAMSRKYLGDQFDIHCGGVDHIPVHHTNEIAQTEAATGKEPWVQYWLHAEFLLTKTFKMSKSEGNFLTLSKIEEMGFEALDYRFFCLGAHYRTQLTFTEQALEGARAGRRALFEKVKSLPSPSPGFGPNQVSATGRDYLDRFEQYLGEDLNMPRALAELWGTLKDVTLGPEEKRWIINTMDRVFGLGLEALTPDGVPVPTQDPALAAEVEALIDERNTARKNKNFARADEIRNQLKGRGITIIDTPTGTSWENHERKM
ncbi:MAG: cysteine--tRNA ligase [Spirochaetales bacterium]|nr:cysteine--tRNA ligase [Spirochaetales bacterium]